MALFLEIVVYLVVEISHMVLMMKTCMQLVQNFEGFKDDNESEDGDGSDLEML